jgi:nicotinamide mononucleotide transporter
MHWEEVCGTISGLAYLYFSIRQSIWTWPLGLLSSALYVYVFFVSKFYADMGLQFYYVIISIYGWYAWLHGNGNTNQDGELKVSRTSVILWVKLFIVNLLLYLGIAYILLHFTDSPVPYWDSFTTALSIVATWMLARKKLEHWLLWVIIDSVSLGLYIYKGLYATVILFFVYTVMAGVGFRAWRKDLINNR